MENVVDGRSDPVNVIRCFRTIETFQNGAEGFNVGVEVGARFLFRDVARQAAKSKSIRDVWRDGVDDEILNFARSKESLTGFDATERKEKLRNRINCCCAGDEILLGDEEISNFFGEVILVLWERIDGGFKLRGSCGTLKGRD